MNVSKIYSTWASDRPGLMAEWFAWSSVLLAGALSARWWMAYVAIVPHIILGKVLLHEDD